MMLNELKKIAIFNKVVECGSFTQAGKLLNLSKSKVSEHVSALESHLKVRLLHRTTRKINLTTEGSAFYHYSSGLLKLAEEAYSAVRPLSAELSGCIRIGTTIDFGSFMISTLISTFSERYPNITFDFQLDDNVQNLVEENLDLVLRIGKLSESAMVGRVLAPFTLGVYASQRYLDNISAITPIKEVEKLDWIRLTRIHLPNDVLILTNSQGDEQFLKVYPKHLSNSPLGVMSMIKEGMGVGLIANFLVEKMNDSKLVRLFPDYYTKDINVNILYPSRKNLPLRVRLFIDYLVEVSRDED